MLPKSLIAPWFAGNWSDVDPGFSDWPQADIIVRRIMAILIKRFIYEGANFCSKAGIEISAEYSAIFTPD
jgi:hypothetical protein